MVFCDDTARIEAHLESGCRRLRGSFYQIAALQVAVQTLAGHLDRLQEWTQAAIEQAEKRA